KGRRCAEGARPAPAPALRRAPLARQVPSSGGGSLAPRIEPVVDCQRTKTYAAPDFGTDMSASLPLTPLAPPLWKCAPTAMVLPSLLRARALPNSSNFRVFEALMKACCDQVVPLRTNTYAAPADLSVFSSLAPASGG